jgi:hypothetical protein
VIQTLTEEISERNKRSIGCHPAGQSDRENIHILESIEHYYGHLGITPIGRIAVKGVDTIDDLNSREDELSRHMSLVGYNKSGLVNDGSKHLL